MTTSVDPNVIFKKKETTRSRATPYPGRLPDRRAASHRGYRLLTLDDHLYPSAFSSLTVITV
jgi:hypothetical protein